MVPSAPEAETVAVAGVGRGSVAVVRLAMWLDELGVEQSDRLLMPTHLIEGQQQRAYETATATDTARYYW